MRSLVRLLRSVVDAGREFPRGSLPEIVLLLMRFGRDAQFACLRQRRTTAAALGGGGRCRRRYRRRRRQGAGTLGAADATAAAGSVQEM
mmetsp:Transcript_17019/g.33899  ORF Transcript_17019/g.33899 Transcript_17019/m.33899 type:complete len:89 (+) Transcript_17019:388-654(+)